MKSKVIKLGIGFLTAIFAFSFFTPVLAEGSYNFIEDSGLETTADHAGYSEELKTTTIETRVSKAINTVLGLLSILFMVLLIYGAFTWMTAFGNEEKVKKALTIITEALVGMMVIFAAYSISWFVLEYLWT